MLALSIAIATTSPQQTTSQNWGKAAPILISCAVLIVLAVLVNSIGGTKRRRKPSRKPQPKSTRPRSSAPPKPKRAPAPPPSPSTSPTSSDGRRMYGRSAGASAAERAEQLRRESVNWAAGSEGERRVGAELDRLPSDAWWVFHDVPRGPSGTNVDHLVIGVGGVYSVNTKNISGNVWVAERTLMINGEKTDYFPVAMSEARDVAKRLARATSWQVRADPLLVFVEPVTIKAMPDDVTVLHLRNVRAWLQARPPILTPEQAYTIVSAADQIDTWA